MSEERGAATATADRPNRLAEDVAEVKGELRQIDKRLFSMEQGQQELRKDVRQVLYLVVVGILVPILLQVVSEVMRR